jgi:hypothetical protein
MASPAGAEPSRVAASNHLCRLKLLLHLSVGLLKLLGVLARRGARLGGLGQDEHAAGGSLAERRCAELLWARRGCASGGGGGGGDEGGPELLLPPLPPPPSSCWHHCPPFLLPKRSAAPRGRGAGRSCAARHKTRSPHTPPPCRPQAAAPAPPCGGAPPWRAHKCRGSWPPRTQQGCGSARRWGRCRPRECTRCAREEGKGAALGEQRARRRPADADATAQQGPVPCMSLHCSAGRRTP